MATNERSAGRTVGGGRRDRKTDRRFCLSGAHDTRAGLLESIYEACLAHELTTRAIPIARQVAVPIRHGKLILDGGFDLVSSSTSK
ncbi:MAG TPA: GxxExxY protein [Alphaproteobacteria bacterium]|nr:GxxExxY protein [Alphaproteobacteria bacterium]